jgi:hypothetical protein
MMCSWVKCKGEARTFYKHGEVHLAATREVLDVAVAAIFTARHGARSLARNALPLRGTCGDRSQKGAFGLREAGCKQDRDGEGGWAPAIVRAALVAQRWESLASSRAAGEAGGHVG